MAKVTITLTDATDGTVDVSLKFDPPFKKFAQTGSQSMAVKMINAVKDDVLDIDVGPGENGEVVHG